LNPTDAELLSRFLADPDGPTFGAIVREHQSAVRRFLRHLCRNGADEADDLAQETFLAAHRSLPAFRCESRLETWLLGIAYNRFRRRRRQWTSDPLAHPGEPGPEPAAPAAPLDLQQDLAAALGQLAEEERTAIVLCFQLGLSHAEAATALGWPVGTVKTRLNRGKLQLKTLLSPWNPQT
jgi:RNA polymerase sigma factor (sigma-70 family)